MTKPPTHLDAWRLFITAHSALIDRIDRDLTAAQQIPLHWYDVLIELQEAPDKRLRLHELADRVVLSRSGLTRLVSRLEDAGLLMRESAPEDGRGAYAVITPQGTDALRSAWNIYARGIEAYFDRFLTDDDANTLRAAFGAMLDALRREKGGDDVHP